MQLNNEQALHAAAQLLVQPAITHAVAAAHRPVVLHLVSLLLQSRKQNFETNSGPVPSDAAVAVALVRVLDIAPHASW